MSKIIVCVALDFCICFDNSVLCASPFIFSTLNFMGPEECLVSGSFCFILCVWQLKVYAACWVFQPKILNFYQKEVCFKLLKLKVSSSSTDKGEYTYIFQSHKASSHNNIPPVISGVGNENPCQQTPIEFGFIVENQRNVPCRVISFIYAYLQEP